MLFTQQKGLCGCASVKELEVGRLSWMIHQGPFEREAGGSLRDTGVTMEVGSGGEV